MVCEVCQLASDGQHFGRSVCRPCAGFYRRTVVHKLEYKCKTDGKCPILKELRKTCAFCRFKKCQEVGMSAQTIQLNRDKNGPLKRSQRSDIVTPVESSEGSKSSSPVEKQPSSSFDTPSAPLSTSSSTSSATFPLLDQLQEGIRNFMHGEKFLHYMLYPESASKATPAVYIKNDEWISMERGCLPLIQAMIGQWFPLYQQLPVDIKVAILQGYHHIFSPLYCCYLNVLYGDDQNFVAHYGQFFHMNESFYDTDEHPTFAWLSVKESCRRCIKMCKDMKTVGIREIEFSAICAIGLANEIGVVFKNDALTTFRSQVYNELHAEIESRYPAAEVGPRIAFLTLLLMDADDISIQEKESITMRKLINLRVSDVFEE